MKSVNVIESVRRTRRFCFCFPFPLSLFPSFSLTLSVFASTLLDKSFATVHAFCTTTILYYYYHYRGTSCFELLQALSSYVFHSMFLCTLQTQLEHPFNNANYKRSHFHSLALSHLAIIQFIFLRPINSDLVSSIIH